LENHYLPGTLEAAVGDFVDHYNHRRVHESLGNATPADAYLRRAPAIHEERWKIKERTSRQCRLLKLP
ncbi:MAG: integrase core domain-containing protein, partial [Pseudomonadota bacterium]